MNHEHGKGWEPGEQIESLSDVIVRENLGATMHEMKEDKPILEYAVLVAFLVFVSVVIWAVYER